MDCLKTKFTFSLKYLIKTDSDSKFLILSSACFPRDTLRKTRQEFNTFVVALLRHGPTVFGAYNNVSKKTLYFESSKTGTINSK